MHPEAQVSKRKIHYLLEQGKSALQPASIMSIFGISPNIKIKQNMKNHIETLAKVNEKHVLHYKTQITCAILEVKVIDNL